MPPNRAGFVQVFPTLERLQDGLVHDVADITGDTAHTVNRAAIYRPVHVNLLQRQRVELVVVLLEDREGLFAQFAARKGRTDGGVVSQAGT